MTARGKHRCHHIETSIVIADGWGVDATIAIGAFQIYLGWSGKAVANLFPVHQILTVEYRYSREILECAVHEIKIVTGTTYAWVGMKAWKHRILESLATNTKCLQQYGYN